MELWDSPPGETKRVPNRARCKDGLALGDTPVSDRWGEIASPSHHVMGLKPPDELSAEQTSTIHDRYGLPNQHAQMYANALHRSVEHLESNQNAQNNRQASMEAAAQNLILSLTTAIQRLKTDIT